MYFSNHPLVTCNIIFKLPCIDVIGYVNSLYKVPIFLFKDTSVSMLIIKTLQTVCVFMHWCSSFADYRLISV